MKIHVFLMQVMTGAFLMSACGTTSAPPPPPPKLPLLYPSKVQAQAGLQRQVESLVSLTSQDLATQVQVKASSNSAFLQLAETTFTVEGQTTRTFKVTLGCGSKEEVLNAVLQVTTNHPVSQKFEIPVQLTCQENVKVTKLLAWEGLDHSKLGAWRPSGTGFATSTIKEPFQVILLNDQLTGRLNTFPVGGKVKAMQWASEDQLFVSFENGRMGVLKVTDGVLTLFPFQDAYCLSVDAAHQRFVVWTAAGASVYNLSGQWQKDFKGPGCGSFSATGEQYAAMVYDQSTQKYTHVRRYNADLTSFEDIPLPDKFYYPEKLLWQGKTLYLIAGNGIHVLAAQAASFSPVDLGNPSDFYFYEGTVGHNGDLYFMGSGSMVFRYHPGTGAVKVHQISPSYLPSTERSLNAHPKQDRLVFNMEASSINAVSGMLLLDEDARILHRYGYAPHYETDFNFTDDGDLIYSDFLTTRVNLKTGQDVYVTGGITGAQSSRKLLFFPHHQLSSDPVLLSVFDNLSLSLKTDISIGEYGVRKVSPGGRFAVLENGYHEFILFDLEARKKLRDLPSGLFFFDENNNFYRSASNVIYRMDASTLQEKIVLLLPKDVYPSDLNDTTVAVLNQNGVDLYDSQGNKRTVSLPDQNRGDLKLVRDRYFVVSEYHPSWKVVLYSSLTGKPLAVLQDSTTSVGQVRSMSLSSSTDLLGVSFYGNGLKAVRIEEP